jgi:hypothetical protein
LGSGNNQTSACRDTKCGGHELLKQLLDEVDFDWSPDVEAAISTVTGPVLPVLPIMALFKSLSHSTIASKKEKTRGGNEDSRD